MTSNQGQDNAGYALSQQSNSDTPGSALTDTVVASGGRLAETVSLLPVSTISNTSSGASTEMSPLLTVSKTTNSSPDKITLWENELPALASSPLAAGHALVSPSSTNSTSLADGCVREVEQREQAISQLAKTIEEGSTRSSSRLKVFSCFVLGAGLELPYNAFITAFDYFQLTYPGRDVEFVLTLAFDPTGFLGFVVGFFWLSKILSLDLRVLTSLILEFLAILLVVIMPHIGSEEAGFIVIVILMGLVGICTSMLHLAVFGLVAPHGSVCCTALMTGVGAAGLITSILRVFTKVVFPNDFEGLKDSAILFFSLAAAWIVGCCMCYCYLRPPDSCKVVSSAAPLGHHHKDSESLCSAISRVSKLMGYHHVVVAACFLLTYVAFPGMLSIIHSDNDELNRTGWYVVILVTVYNFCNFISSSVANRLRLFKALQSGRLLILSCLRVVFPIVFGLCSFADLHIPDVFIYLLVVVFGLSQGYLASLAVVLGTELSPNDAQLAGEMMSFALAIGIMSGTVIAFIISQALH